MVIMYYVYVIKSVKHPSQIYIGYTGNVETRLTNHNKGQVPHTSKFKPWKVVVHMTFENKKKAMSFEKYLKSGSGRQFLRKHFL
jgi:predicted GIY-YIG superfamily endonuclease